MALQDSSDPPEDPQPGWSVHDRDPAASTKTPDVGPYGLVLTGLQDPADPLPGPSGPKPRSPKCTGASKRRRVGDQNWFRTTSSPGPSTLPFSEVYEVGEEIGEGGFGTVYEGILKCTREQVAIKMITKRDLDNQYILIPGCPEPLFAEVALNLLLNQPPVSPYIVHMLDWFEEKDRYILILEHPQPCKDLQRFVISNILRMNESMASDLIYQAVLGAKHCFDRGVFHRDIKLNNFLINTTTNQVKLIDFGCGDLIKSSYFGDFKGACRPPEYYIALKYEAGPTTVWSLGIMMCRMLCRRQPFDNLEEMMHGMLTFNSRISKECQDLINRCLTCDPTKRATIEEILQHEWFQRGRMSRVLQESGSVP
ncbi:serine/threonine-protein kinase pim-1-like [Pseudorasbora parva]|uniref:serine/threonine-protein kinase pim-1-like n=1 Tax=Pseudorasbora parva TaxID=51549 RepID=UPI00351DC2F4